MCFTEIMVHGCEKFALVLMARINVMIWLATTLDLLALFLLFGHSLSGRRYPVRRIVSFVMIFDIPTVPATQIFRHILFQVLNRGETNARSKASVLAILSSSFLFQQYERNLG